MASDENRGGVVVFVAACDGDEVDVDRVERGNGGFIGENVNFAGEGGDGFSSMSTGKILRFGLRGFEFGDDAIDTFGFF